MPADTSIPVSDAVWEELRLRKQRGDTFDDVLRRELGLDDDEPEPPTDIEAAIAAWRPDDDVEVDHDHARDALRQAVAWLRQQDGARRKAEIIAGAYRDGPLSERIWWTRGARPGLQALDRVAKEGRKYRWVGED